MPEIPNVLSLEGRVAVVTGAGRGIGAATARMLARAGAQVALLDRDAAGVTHTAEQIGLEGGEALPFTNDITDAFAVERTFDRVVDEWGRLDVLVNNAGVLKEALARGADGRGLPGDARREPARGHGVRAGGGAAHDQAGPRAHPLGRLRLDPPRAPQGLTAYAAAKAGIVGMTRTWARELGPKGITANAVAPGLIDSETVRTVPADELEATLARIPARRLGTPDEVAAVYLFLASDLASFINGAVVGVDGGLLLY